MQAATHAKMTRQHEIWDVVNYVCSTLGPKPAKSH